MEIQSALVLTIIFFIIFTVTTYYGAQVTFWSSFTFGLFIALVLLNMFYPISQLTENDATFSLWIYAVFQVIGIIILAIYITLRTLSDVRSSDSRESAGMSE